MKLFLSYQINTKNISFTFFAFNVPIFFISDKAKYLMSSCFTRSETLPEDLCERYVRLCICGQSVSTFIHDVLSQWRALGRPYKYRTAASIISLVACRSSRSSLCRDTNFCFFCRWRSRCCSPMATRREYLDKNRRRKRTAATRYENWNKIVECNKIADPQGSVSISCL